MLAVQAGAANAASWRIAATGAVLGGDPAPRVVKKLKLVGEPTTIHKRTAFVRGLFNSPLEASKFEGATVRTAAGLRGIIKKAATARAAKGAPGTVRVSFEDKPLLSDVVFLRAWVAVDLPALCLPVTDLLAPAAGVGRAVGKPGRDKEEERGGARGGERAPAGAAELEPAPAFAGARAGWVFTTRAAGTGYYRERGGGEAGGAAGSTAIHTTAPTPAAAPGWVPVRTVAELRRAAGVGAPRAPDSLYRPVDRAPRRFNPLRVPKALQASLPFKSKPREAAPRKGKSLEQKRAVVLDGAERKTASLVAQLNAIRNAKAVKRKAKEAGKRAAHAAKKAADGEWRAALQKEERKKRYVAAGVAAKAAAYKKRGREE